MSNTLVLGAVAYAPKVVTIWEGFKEFFVRHGLPFDFILYSNYERQVEAQFRGEVHLAWNSPLAWLRAERMAKARGVSDQVRAIAMRDTDCDLTSVIVVRTGAGIQTLADAYCGWRYGPAPERWPATVAQAARYLMNLIQAMPAPRPAGKTTEIKKQ